MCLFVCIRLMNRFLMSWILLVFMLQEARLSDQYLRVQILVQQDLLVAEVRVPSVGSQHLSVGRTHSLD